VATVALQPSQPAEPHSLISCPLGKVVKRDFVEEASNKTGISLTLSNTGSSVSVSSV